MWCTTSKPTSIPSKSEGKAEVKLAGRTFTIEKQFLEDVASQNISRASGR
jgi:hypothetical protein